MELIEQQYRLEKCLRKAKEGEMVLDVQVGGVWSFDKRPFLKYFKDPVIIDFKPLPQVATLYLIAERNPPTE